MAGSSAGIKSATNSHEKKNPDIYIFFCIVENKFVGAISGTVNSDIFRRVGPQWSLKRPDFPLFQVALAFFFD